MEVSNKILPLVGPEIPLQIAELRAKRRKEQKESVPLIGVTLSSDSIGEGINLTPSTSIGPEVSDEDNSSSDDDYGPKLPSESDSENDQEAETKAMERLNAREAKDESSSAHDKAGWMSIALGGNSQDVPTYNPKTFRRNVSLKMDSSWSEAQTERSKRMAQEMMGLENPASKKSKSKSTNEADMPEIGPQDPDSERNARQSLLDQRIAERQAKAIESGNAGDLKLDWERDITGTKGMSSQNLNAIVQKARAYKNKFQSKSS